jgi:hypothetical protein
VTFFWKKIMQACTEPCTEMNMHPCMKLTELLFTSVAAPRTRVRLGRTIDSCQVRRDESRRRVHVKSSGTPDDTNWRYLVAALVGRTIWRYSRTPRRPRTSGLHTPWTFSLKFKVHSLFYYYPSLVHTTRCAWSHVALCISGKKLYTDGQNPA